MRPLWLAQMFLSFLSLSRSLKDGFPQHLKRAIRKRYSCRVEWNDGMHGMVKRCWCKEHGGIVAELLQPLCQ